MARTSIFIVHENPILAGQAARLLNNDPILHVMDLIPSTQEALTLLEHENCDFVFVSAALAKNGALQLLKCLRQQSRGVKVIVTGLQDDPKQILAYLAAGAADYILKKEGISAWITHIHAVRHGQAPLSSSTMAALMPLYTGRQVAAGVESHVGPCVNLTSRECEILELWAAGNSLALIAEHLVMAVGTVKNYVQNVLKKLRLRSRKEVNTYLTFAQRRAYTSQVAYAH